MNTRIYKQVLSLAKELMSCVHKKDQNRFDVYYAELKKVCDENDGTEKDHPVQWETLADFTDDLEQALSLYDKALLKASAINSKDYLSSIGFSAARMQVDLGNKERAVEYLEQAKIHSNKIIDKELKADIHDLLKKLTTA